jgi:hypothetical protein
MNQAPYDSASTVAPEFSARAIRERREARIWLGLLAAGALLWLFSGMQCTYQNRRSADARIVRLAGRRAEHRTIRAGAHGSLPHDRD